MQGPEQQKVRIRTVKLMMKGAVTAIGGSVAIVALTATPGWAAEQVSPSPYVPAESSPGVIDMNQTNLTASGLPVGQQWFAGLCDGVPFNSPIWNANADCGAFSSGVTVQAAGTANFGGNPEAANPPPQSFLVWHGSASNDLIFGEQQFNCLAPDDNPSSTVTKAGNEPIDPNEPTWGASAGAGPGGGGSAPCQIRVTNSLSTFQSTDLADNYDIPTTPPVPESPFSVGLPVGAAVVLGGGVLVTLRRRRRHAQAAA
jgi:hypothetical protein